MARFRYYMDFGAGWVEITIFDNQLNHIVIRDISEFSYRTALDGSFKMQVSNYTNLPDLIETTEVIDFKFEQDQNIGGSPVWVTIFEGIADLRGEIDWTKDIITIKNFTKIEGKLEKLMRLWNEELTYLVNNETHDINITDGTTSYDLIGIGSRLAVHLEDDIASWGMSELTLITESLPFDSDKLEIFPTRIFDANINYSPGSAQSETFTIKEQLQIYEDLFQVYWYIDETIPATSKLIFYRPDDTPVSRLVLDGVYTNCIASDIGKIVLDDAVGNGELLDFDNTNQVWWIRATSEIADNSAMTITSGTGAGTAAGASDSDLFPMSPQTNIESEVVNIRRDKYLSPKMVWQEKFNFANENADSDFVGFPLRYPNETEHDISYDLKHITTNVFGARENATGGASAEVVNGLSVVWVTNVGSNEYDTDQGTGLISSTTISNEFLSKARLHENWFKINRYHIRSGMYLNDSLIALSDGAIEKHIRDYPVYSAVLPALPTGLGTQRWEFDSPDELIALEMKSETPLETGVTEYSSRQLKSWL